jgi:hypothetical protein
MSGDHANARGKRHGDRTDTDGGFTLHVRCRRKDFPKPAKEECETCGGKGGYSDGVSDQWYTCPDCYETPQTPDKKPLTPFQEKMKAIGEEQKAVERIPVRLWVTHRLPTEHGDWPVRASVGNPDLPGWHEIVSDCNGGFRVEVPK